MSQSKPKHFYICYLPVSGVPNSKIIFKDFQVIFPAPTFKTSITYCKDPKIAVMTVVSDEAIDLKIIKRFEISHSSILFSHNSESPFEEAQSHAIPHGPYYAFSVFVAHNFTDAERLKGEPERLKRFILLQLGLSGYYRRSKFSPNYTAVFLQSPEPIDPLKISSLVELLKLSPHKCLLSVEVNG